MLLAQGLAGLPQDYASARRWYERSAAQGCADGAYNLALLFAKGLGVRRDPAAARVHCARAAALGQRQAEAALPHLEAAALAAGPARAPARPLRCLRASPEADLGASGLSEPLLLRGTMGFISIGVVMRGLCSPASKHKHRLIHACMPGHLSGLGAPAFLARLLAASGGVEEDYVVQ